MKKILLFSNWDSCGAAPTEVLWRGEGIHLLGADGTAPSRGAGTPYITTQPPALVQKNGTNAAML